MAFSTASYYTNSSNDSSKGYAIAASDSSYQYYNNMTWSMWCALGPGNSKHIWSLWEQVSGNNRSWMFSSQTDGTVRCLFSWNGTSFSLHKSAVLVFDYSWKHIVFTFASGSFNCYINGALVTLNQTIAWGGGAAALHNPAIQHIVAGHSPSAPVADAAPSGSMNNFSLWSKVLSAAEILELYNNGMPYDISTHSAVANLTNWLRMDQTDSSTTLTDSITSAANATIVASGTSGEFKQGNNYANSNPIVIPTAAEIADAVWDEAASGHVTSGTFGLELGTNIAEHDATQAAIAAIPSPSVPTAAAIADAVWDEDITTHTTASTFGLLMQKLLTVAKFLGLK